MREQRLIDANALEQDLISKGLYPSIVKRAIENASTIEAEHVQHGKWILDFLSPYRRNHYKCSACGKRSAKISLYCPNCGTRMNKE